MRTRNWPEIMAQLAIFFQDRLQGYLCKTVNRSAYAIFETLPIIWSSLLDFKTFS